MILNLGNLFRKNLPVKICALIAAIILWGYVMNEQNPAVNGSFTIPVEITNAPNGYKITQSEEKVRVKVRAPRSIMAAARESDFKAEADLGGITEEGEYQLKLKLTIPQGFERIETSLDTVEVSLESMIARGVPVAIMPVGKPIAGLTLGEIVPSQLYVNVYGPRRDVESVARVEGKVPVSDNTTDFTLRIHLYAVNNAGNMVNEVAILPEELDVNVNMIQGTDRKTVPVKVVLEGNLQEGYSLDTISVEPMQIELIGNEKNLGEIKSINTKPIHLNGLTQEAVQDVDIDLPEGVMASNKKVTVRARVLEK